MFYVGQIVECIDDTFQNLEADEAAPKKGQRYTVRGLLRWEHLEGMVLAEIHNPRKYAVGCGEAHFITSAFRPIVEKKTDTGFAILEDILRRETIDEVVTKPRVHQESK